MMRLLFFACSLLTALASVNLADWLGEKSYVGGDLPHHYPEIAIFSLGPGGNVTLVSKDDPGRAISVFVPDGRGGWAEDRVSKRLAGKGHPWLSKVTVETGPHWVSFTRRHGTFFYQSLS